MSMALAPLTFVMAIAAAVRSTWSPCGISMLSTITPIGERGRGNRYRSTALWFVVGAVLGGATLGAAMAALAAGVAMFHPTSTELLAAAAGVCAVAVASDSSLFGVRLPVHRRQVNELWLSHFRAWVYGGGFGLQIGAGVATYIMTAAVYTMIALAALGADPMLALLVGTVFGLVRGLAVLLGRGLTSTAALQEFHRRFDAMGPRVQRVVLGVQLAVLLAIVAVLWLPGAAIAVVGVMAWGIARLRRRTAVLVGD